MENAELYTVYNFVQRRDAEMILAEFSSLFNWSENENVLDIGCGPGDVSTEVLLPYLSKDACMREIKEHWDRLTNAFSPENCFTAFTRVLYKSPLYSKQDSCINMLQVGVDLSSNMVEFANEKYSNDKVHFKTLDFATKDIKKYFPEKHFSKIFSCHCLHWIHDQKQLGQNLFTLLRPGGEFLAVMTPSSQLFLALKLLSGFDQFKQYCQDVDDFIPPLYNSLNPSDDFKLTLEAQGLEVITCEQRLNHVTYPNIQVMKRAFEAFNPFVKRMPEAVKEEYLTYFDHLVRQRIPISESGEIHFQNPIIVVFARRPLQSWSFNKPLHICSGKQ